MRINLLIILMEGHDGIPSWKSFVFSKFLAWLVVRHTVGHERDSGKLWQKSRAPSLPPNVQPISIFLRPTHLHLFAYDLSLIGSGLRSQDSYEPAGIANIQIA